MKSFFPFACITFVVGFIGGGVLTLAADPVHDWPQFLGPLRNGISIETGLLDQWPADGPRKVWEIPGGVGMSGLAISQNKLVTLVQRDGKQLLVAHDSRTGKALWQLELAGAYRNAMGDGPRATPAISGNRVFAFTGEGILVAANLENGKKLWSHHCLQDHNGKEADYGMASSPLVVDGKVVVTIGTPDATIVAYDSETGKLAWKAGSDDLAGYSSPALLKVGGSEQLVVFSGDAVLGIKPANGEVLWKHPYTTDFGCNIATPLSYKGQIFVSSGENHGCVLLSIKEAGPRFSVSEIWSSQGGKSVLRNEWQTSILLGDYLYGFDNVGGAGPISHLTCIHAATGKRQWQQTRFGKGNLIAADGKLFISTMQGELVVLKANSQKYEELGRTTVLGTTRQAPALANGLLYLRDSEKIVCLDVRRS